MLRCGIPPHGVGRGNPNERYLHVEKPFLDQLATLGWTVIDQGHGFVPSDPAATLRDSSREWLLPEVFRESVRAINTTLDGTLCLTDRQLDDLRSQILRQPNRTLLEANEAIHALFLKAQVDRNEITGAVRHPPGGCECLLMDGRAGLVRHEP